MTANRLAGFVDIVAVMFWFLDVRLWSIISNKIKETWCGRSYSLHVTDVKCAFYWIWSETRKDVPLQRHGVHGKSVLWVQDRKVAHVSARILCTSAFSVLWFRIASSLTVLLFSVTFLRQNQVNVESIVYSGKRTVSCYFHPPPCRSCKRGWKSKYQSKKLNRKCPHLNIA